MSTRSRTPNSSGVPAPDGPDEADRVRVVDHHQGVVALGQVADLVERREVAVHREDAVGDDQPTPGALAASQLLLEVGHVPVAVAQALRLAQPDAVDDRGVVELVGDDRVLGAEQHLEHAAVGVEAGREQDRGLGAEKRGELVLELDVLGLRAADEPHAGHPEAPRVERACAAATSRGSFGQPQVVVGAEVQDVLAARTHVRGLRRGQLALRLVEAGGPDLGEVAVELRANVGVDGRSSCSVSSSR